MANDWRETVQAVLDLQADEDMKTAPGPSLQWYPQQWLSDPAVQLMSMTARGCHHHLLMVAWKGFDADPDAEAVPCSLPATAGTLKALCQHPEGWAEVYEEVKVGWKDLDGRIWNLGLCRSYLHQMKNRRGKQKGGRARALQVSLSANADEDPANARPESPNAESGGSSSAPTSPPSSTLATAREEKTDPKKDLCPTTATVAGLNDDSRLEVMQNETDDRRATPPGAGSPDVEPPAERPANPGDGGRELNGSACRDKFATWADALGNTYRQAMGLRLWRAMQDPPDPGTVLAWIVETRNRGWPNGIAPDAVEVIEGRMWEGSGKPDKPKRSGAAEVDLVIRSLDEGIRALRGIQGRKHRPLSLTVDARRQQAWKLLKSMDGTAWIVARNIVLMPHNRGENDRAREYLSFTPNVRTNPEAFLELCPSEDFGEFEAALRLAVKTGRRRATAKKGIRPQSSVEENNLRDARMRGQSA